jgi:hypothetical protein
MICHVANIFVEPPWKIHNGLGESVLKVDGPSLEVER